MNGVMTAKIRGLVIMAMIHCGFCFGSSFHTRLVISMTSTEQPKIGDVTNAEGCLLLKVDSATSPFTGDRSDSVSVLVDSSLLEQRFDGSYVPDCEAILP